MTISLVIVGVLSFYMFLNPNVIKNNKTTYSFLILCVVAIGYRICLYIFGNKSEFSNLPVMIGATIVVCSILAIVYFWNTSGIKSFVTNRVLNTLLVIAIFLFGLAFIFSLTKNKINGLQNEYSWLGFITQFIFFIPCMIYDFVVYLANQFNATSNIVFILFVIELVLITLFVSSPYLLNYLLNVKSTFLLSDAAFLTHKNLLSDSNPMVLDNRDGEQNIRNNFSLSLWVYIDDYYRTPNGNSKTIFHYGDEGSLSKGHPHIDYKDRQLVFTFSNRGVDLNSSENEENELVYKMDIEPQKWVFIVFNYKYNEADLFVDAQLKKTVHFTEKYPEYNLSDIIYIGDKQGVDGAICNVIYYPFPQTRSDITSQYNLLMFSNPPVYSTFLMNKKGGIPREMV